MINRLLKTLALAAIFAGCKTEEKTDVQIQTGLIFEAVEDANKGLVRRIESLEADVGLLKSTPRDDYDVPVTIPVDAKKRAEADRKERNRKRFCPKKLTKTWDAAKEEWYCN